MLPSEDLLESLSLLSSGPSFSGGNMNHASCDDTAVELVDQIILGSADEVARFIKDGKRDEFYSRLHDLDNSWPKNDEERPKYFNDVLWTAEWYGGKVPVWAANPA